MSTHTDHSECKHLLASISDYVDGELSDKLCSEIEHHLAECEDCRLVVNTMKKTIELYHTTARNNTDVPTDVRSRLFHRLDLEDYLEK